MIKSHKDTVKLRGKKTAAGKTSLYLDIYAGGRRSYEFLRLYLVPEKTKADKDANERTQALAERVCAKRLLELQNDRFGFERAPSGDMLFTRFFDKCLQKKKAEGAVNTFRVWQECILHIAAYDKALARLRVSDINRKWVEGFRSYLLGAKSLRGDGSYISQNTARHYFNTFRAAINAAFKSGLITRKPTEGVDCIKPESTKREYLTFEELQRLAATPHKHDWARRAFLFSALTGLRWSDVSQLTWGMVQRQGEFTRINFKQRKTGGVEYLDISPQAVEQMGAVGAPDDRVFPKLTHLSSYARHLQSWVAAAGIDKHITFHCARHTFAVMMLDLGTDIYTVSKLLGHTQIATTQIYAKVLDKNKQKAVMRIPSLTGEKETAQDD